VYNKNEILLIEQLANTIWHEHFTAIIGSRQVNYMLAKFQSQKAINAQLQQGYSYFLMMNNKTAFGYMATQVDNKQLFLSKFYICSTQRNQGYGKKALLFIEQLAKQSALNKISLTVNKDNNSAIQIYKKLGFTHCGTQVKDIGNHFVMDDYLMEKTL